MSIFTKGSPEDYLQHIIAVLHLIDLEGFHMQYKKHAKEMKTAAVALETLELSVGPWDSDSEQDQEALETEKKTHPRVILNCLQAVQRGHRGYIQAPVKPTSRQTTDPVGSHHPRDARA